jgi:serine/threonine-protein kinase
MTAVPASFGKYFLSAKLATGGMAEIYLAKLIGPSGFEKRLVIKQIHPQFSRERQFVDLFVAEAKTLVSLSHGNIVPIYELGMVENIYFIAMEYIDGPTLERLATTLRRHGEMLSPSYAGYIAAEILKGLDYAHRKAEGVIHRDLSTRNVMLSREGEVKLVDFGLAVHGEGRQLSRGAGGRPAGSFPYMSPEQVRGEKLDPRSDIFSAGVLLWEMLAGRTLFARPDPDETLTAVTEAEIVPPSQHNVEVPDELDAICLRALERDREQRYQTAAKFLRPLSRYLYSSEAVVGPADLSRLLALHCPPSGRERLASETGEPDESQPPGDGADHLGGTVVMPKRASRPPPEPAEHVQTFATNAVWQEELREAGAASAPLSTPLESDPDATVDIPAPSLAPGSARSWATSAAVAAAVGFAILAAVLWVRSQGGASARPSDAMPDATRAMAADAGLAAPAAPPDGGDLEARAPADAGARPSGNGDHASRPPRQRDAAARPIPAPSGSGTIQIGAMPWAEVEIDGTPVGSAPGRFEVRAGRHKIKATFKDQSKTWTVVIADGDRKELFHDFGGGAAP